MTITSQIEDYMKSRMATCPDEFELSANDLAQASFDHFNIGPVDPHIAYASNEHLKQIARRLLRVWEPTNTESVAYQGDMFSGQLQARYPKADKSGTYVHRKYMSVEDFQYNIYKLELAGNALLKHSNALLALGQSVYPELTSA